jgi:acetyl-CoA carboxylase carboxyl transferase subunit beta
MNWITKFIKQKIKSLFKKKTSSSDETLWISCECKNLIYKEDFKTNYYCCTKCGAHHKLSCKDRFKLFFDNADANLIGSSIASMSIYILMAIVLIFKPSGLFGERSA